MLHCTYINTHAGFFVELLAVQINVRGNVLESHQALKKVTVYCTSLHSCLTAWFFPNAAVSTTRSISRNLCNGQFILFTLYSWSELCNCCQLSCNYAKPYRRQAGSWQQMEETESKRRRQRRHCWWEGDANGGRPASRCHSLVPLIKSSAFVNLCSLHPDQSLELLAVCIIS